jgi:hypothetical protein
MCESLCFVFFVLLTFKVFARCTEFLTTDFTDNSDENQRQNLSFSIRVIGVIRGSISGCGSAAPSLSWFISSEKSSSYGGRWGLLLDSRG